MSQTAATEPTSLPGGRYTEDQVDYADQQFGIAFAEAGLIAETGELVCPVCHTAGRKKVQIKTSTKTGRSYWTCHKCPDTWGSSAIKLLVQSDAREVSDGRKWRDAVATLLRLSVDGAGQPIARKKIVPVEAEAAFAAANDIEVYDRIRNAGSLAKAQEYWARWHIAPEAVVEAGSTVIENAKALHQELLTEFGADRLRAAGVITSDAKGNDVFLFNDDYNVIEAHMAPSGHVMGMQFRPSGQRMATVNAHKAWKKRWSGILDENGDELDPKEAWRRAYEQDQAVGDRIPYATPFLSLKGAGENHLVGCGLRRLTRIAAPSTVYIVEGFKDLLAARTMGVEAYAIPGTGVMPPERAVAILRQHTVVVSLDGDEAGARGRAAVVDYLTERGVNARAGATPRDGMDVTDTLVERHAHSGCSCDTCTAWRDGHPYDAGTCPCATCRSRR